MLKTHTCDDVVVALAEAPIDERTGNKVLYSVSWQADRDSMIGKRNENWVRRELTWFNSGSDSLADMEEPVPQAFRACAGWDGRVNSAYGHILFSTPLGAAEDTMFRRVVDAFIFEGKGTRHSVAIISDRNIEEMATSFGRKDFICTNALNFMIDADDKLHITAQMRSMDAVWGYRADYSMWEDLMGQVVGALTLTYPEVSEGTITFQVANLHVYPRHFQLLEDTAADIEERLQRRVWAPPALFSDATGGQR